MATELVIDFDDTPLTRHELETAITNMRYRAGREFPKVERFTKDPPTPWTTRHRAINALLTQWEAATRTSDKSSSQHYSSSSCWQSCTYSDDPQGYPR